MVWCKIFISSFPSPVRLSARLFGFFLPFVAATSHQPFVFVPRHMPLRWPIVYSHCLPLWLSFLPHEQQHQQTEVTRQHWATQRQLGACTEWKNKIKKKNCWRNGKEKWNKTRLSEGRQVDADKVEGNQQRASHQEEQKFIHQVNHKNKKSISNKNK